MKYKVILLTICTMLATVSSVSPILASDITITGEINGLIPIDITTSPDASVYNIDVLFKIPRLLINTNVSDFEYQVTDKYGYIVATGSANSNALVGLKEGDYTLTVVADGCEPYKEDFTISTNEPIKTIDVSLVGGDSGDLPDGEYRVLTIISNQPGFNVKIYDTKGNTIVEMNEIPGDIIQIPITFEGDYNVEVIKAGYYTDDQKINLDKSKVVLANLYDNPDEVTPPYDPDEVIVSQELNIQSNLSGYSMDLERVESDGTKTVIAKQDSVTDKNYTIPIKESGNYVATFTKPTYNQITFEGKIEAGDTTVLPLEFIKGDNIVTPEVKPDTKQLAIHSNKGDYTISLVSNDYDYSVEKTITDKDYTLDVEYPGNYSLVATKDGYKDIGMELNLDLDTSVDLNFTSISTGGGGGGGGSNNNKPKPNKPDKDLVDDNGNANIDNIIDSIIDGNTSIDDIIDFIDIDDIISIIDGLIDNGYDINDIIDTIIDGGYLDDIISSMDGDNVNDIYERGWITEYQRNKLFGQLIKSTYDFDEYITYVDTPITKIVYWSGSSQTRASDVNSYITKDTDSTMVPLRNFTEVSSDNPEIEWRQATKSCYVEYPTVKMNIEYFVNSSTLLVNGYEYQMTNSRNEPLVATMENDRMYVPLRYFGEFLGFNVTWDKATKTADIIK